MEKPKNIYNGMGKYRKDLNIKKYLLKFYGCL